MALSFSVYGYCNSHVGNMKKKSNFSDRVVLKFS